MILPISQWIVSTFEADTALLALVSDDPTRIRHGTRDRGQSLPVVTFQLLAGGEEGSDRCGNPNRSRAVFLVKAVVRGTVDDAAPLWDRINALLTGAAAAGGGYQWQVSRESIVAEPEVTNDARFFHYGGTWAFEAQEV